jgi:hypothetical protein
MLLPLETDTKILNAYPGGSKMKISIFAASILSIFFSMTSFAGDYTSVAQIHPAMGDVFTNPDFPKTLDIARAYLREGEQGLRVGGGEVTVHSNHQADIKIEIYPQQGGGCVTSPIGQIIAEADGSWISSNLRFVPAESNTSKTTRCR